MSPRSRTPGRLVGFPVGGRWDRLERRYVGPGEASRVITLEDGQLEIATVWFDWLQGYITDDWRDYRRRHGARPYSMWGVGGRRKGKSFFGIQSVALFSVAIAGSFPWIVSETEDDFQEEAELMRYWARFLDPSWYEVNERELYVQVINGTRVSLKSGHNPENTKKGESSYVFLNEAQKMPQQVYDNCRGGTTDSGSIVLVAANPPRTAKGYWVHDIVRKLRRGDVDGYLKEFNDDNPHVNEASLDAMAKEMSRRDYQIEREGRFMARTDVVMHSFEDGERGNVQVVPEIGDITEHFLRRKLGRPFKAVIGADFQLAPHMAGVVERYFVDPDDPNDALSWTVEEAVVDQGDENDLIDVLESMGLTGAECAVIADASGEWQQGDRAKGKMTGRGSFDMFRARGWKNLFKPDPKSDRNPLILERVAVGNARLRSHDERQHAFIAPHCVLTAEALSKWPNGREGFPSRRSQFSHIGDAWTYPKFRLWPRRLEPKRGGGRIHTVDIHGRDDKAF